MHGDGLFAAALGGDLVICDDFALELGAVEVLDGDVVDYVDVLLCGERKAGKAKCDSDDVLFHRNNVNDLMQLSENTVRRPWALG